MKKEIGKKRLVKKAGDVKKKAAERAGRLVAPGTREDLRRWVQMYARMQLPECGTCVGHCTPLDYLEHVFFEKGETGDTVVWACRGGGKTMIGAVATLLDLLFKPGVQVRILGGSKEQSERMYTYLCKMVEEGFADVLKGKVGRRGLSLRNGSRVEILTQSQTSVRGTRVQKMRCDELELFDEGVWDAAQLTTRSMWVEDDDEPRRDEVHEDARRIEEEEGGRGDGEKREEGTGGEAKACTANKVGVRGAVEVFSTMHRPSGLMSKLVGRAGCAVGELGAGLEGAPKRKVFAWCIWDVVGRCREEDRACESCVLLGDCKSRARAGKGFVPIVDVLRFHERTARGTWESEMLCQVPYPEGQVFGAFRREVHVRGYPLERFELGGSVVEGGRSFLVEGLIAGIDYGWKKFVCLWLALLRDAAGRRVVWAVDEYVMPERALEGHVAALLARPAWKSGAAWKPAVFYGDVAGKQHDAHTGVTSEGVLRAAGLAVKSRAMKIEEGVEAVRRLIEPSEAWGQAVPVPRFFVDSRCTGLIEALANYSMGKDGKPVKDGEHDHLIDALRYAVVGHDGGGGGKVELRYY